MLNQIKFKISSQPKMEKSMTQETTWFRTFVIRTDTNPSADSLVSCPQTLTLDGGSLKSDASCCTSPDHLVDAQFIYDSKQNT